jgi:hypothetical protein
MATRIICIPVLTDVEIARFWNKVQIRNIDECWLWTGKRSKTNQYGAFWLSRNGTQFCVGPHCIAWQLSYGEIPVGLLVRHRCDTQGCVNPFHLELGRDKDNKCDSILRNRNKRILSDDQIRLIRSAYPIRSQCDIAAEFGVNQSLVSQIVNRKIYNYVEDRCG